MWERLPLTTSTTITREGFGFSQKSRCHLKFTRTQLGSYLSCADLQQSWHYGSEKLWPDCFLKIFPLTNPWKTLQCAFSLSFQRELLYRQSSCCLRLSAASLASNLVHVVYVCSSRPVCVAMANKLRGGEVLALASQTSVILFHGIECCSVSRGQ